MKINSTPTLREQKNLAKKQLCKKYSIAQNVRSLIVLDISETSLCQQVMEACNVADIGVICIAEHSHPPMQNTAIVSSLSIDEYLAFDAFVTEGVSWNVSIMDMMRAWVVPILPKENHLSVSLHEFDPMHFEGNSFLFVKMNPYAIFEKIISYLENIKFPEDKRILLKNVSNTFA